MLSEFVEWRWVRGGRESYSREQTSRAVKALLICEEEDEEDTSNPC